MSSIKKVKVVDSIVEEMLSKIRSGEFKPGEKIPSEQALTKEFGVSRTSLREAYKKLELLGTIIIRQGDGTYLNESLQDQLIHNEIRTLFTVGNMNISEYLEARKILEIKAAGLAAKRATTEDIEKLSKIVNDFASHIDDPEIYKEIDFEFHQTIVNTAKNRFISQFWTFLIPLIKEQQGRSNYIMGVTNNSVISHRELLDAIINKKSKAAEKCMEEHLSMIPGRLITEISRRVTNSEKKEE